MNYIRVVYPLIEVGKSHNRPSLPECVINIHEGSVTWNIHSTNDDDRAEYWEVDETKYNPSYNPPLMTASEVETTVYGPAGKAAWIAANT